MSVNFFPFGVCNRFIAFLSTFWNKLKHSTVFLARAHAVEAVGISWLQKICFNFLVLHAQRSLGESKKNQFLDNNSVAQLGRKHMLTRTAVAVGVKETLKVEVYPSRGERARVSRDHR